MKKYGYIICLIFLIVPSFILRAELELNLRFENNSVLQYEAINADLLIRNNTVNIFKVPSSGENKTSPVLRFIVEKKQYGQYEEVSKISDVPLLKKIRIYPGMERKIIRDISLWSDVRDSGNYMIRAEMNWGNRVIRSNKIMVNVVPGIELREDVMAIYGYPDIVLTYSLRYWWRNRKEYLFLKVDDKKNRLNYGVFNLGPIIRILKPTLNVDVLGNVEILHQSGYNRYTRTLFKTSKEGMQFIKQSHHKKDGSLYSIRGFRAMK